jgi:hypothetical protein
MIRLTMLSLALLVITGARESRADEPKTQEKKGFRVYSISLRCQTRTLLGTYESPEEAFRRAAEFRTKSPRVEVTTGSEGKQRPNGQPLLCHVYTKACDKEGWQRDATVEEKKVAQIVKDHKAKNLQVEVVNDYAPSEVYQIYGGGCTRSLRLLGTYATMRETGQAAEEFRTSQKLRNCLVTTGTRGQSYYSLGTPAQYKVYFESCKGRWILVTTTNDAKKAQEAANKQKKDNRQVEVVQHYTKK